MTEPFYFKRYDMVIGKAENLSELRKELEIKEKNINMMPK